MIKVRIPPSPTGLLHIGTARTALYNYLFAKKEGGVMVFRVEDTDKTRSKKEYEDDIVNGLRKLGLDWEEGLDASGDHGPYRQSERTDIYLKYLKELMEKDLVYYCFCSKERLEEVHREQMAQKKPPRYDGACSEINTLQARQRVEKGESAVVRLRVSNDQDLRFDDLVRGETVIHSKELDDMIIARKMDDPLYNFTVVIDDHLMEITHVIRGEDHISNTPKQILIYQAFGWQPPEFAHLPLILNEDKSKLSKRKNKVSVDDYLNEGFLPEALINFLALLGWNTPDEQEIFSMEELADKFSLDRVHKGGAVFDIKKLEWINGEYIKKAIKEDVNGFYETLSTFISSQASVSIQEARLADRADWMTNNPTLIKSILQHPDLEGRFKKLSDIPEALAVFFEPLPDYSLDLIAREKFKITPEMLQNVMKQAIQTIEGLEWETGDSKKTEALSEAMVNIVGLLELKNGQVLWPIRVALSGLERSPNFATLMVYLGKEEVLRRLNIGLKKTG